MTAAERCKKWRLNNAEKLTTRLECECGSKYAYGNKGQHFQTQKHKRYEEYKMTIESIQQKVNELNCTKSET
jgi:hypothetical protein